ncbi:phosphotransferase [Azospirillum sp. SYSU D00513]|uniref:aminoglycoside phosphotransferase family protein n=2 Tax=Pseudomonadati TaxID=3379134 RepID=UPI001A957BA5|nr:phosphotransferase [Azospirillum sp. SYSU D00513]
MSSVDATGSFDASSPVDARKRVDAIAAFLARNGLGGARRTPLAGDASARRYERVEKPGGGTVILVDTPAPADDLVPFIVIGETLRRLGLSAPEILAAEVEAGLAIQEDFGDDTLSRLLGAGEDPHALYALATDALIALHRDFPPAEATRLGLPRYDAPLFTEQVALLAEVYVPAATGKSPSDAALADFAAAWGRVVPAACDGPQSLLLRDYHVDNVMRLPRPGVRAAGLIDFQNAGLGPVAYDLVSLLEDARRDVPADLAEAMVARYLAAFPGLDAAAFRRSYAVLGAVRHTRIVAVFVRLALQQGKRAYLTHLPRVWRLLEAQLAKPELAPLAEWFARHLPPGTRADFVVPEPD